MNHQNPYLNFRKSDQKTRLSDQQTFGMLGKMTDKYNNYKLEKFAIGPEKLWNQQFLEGPG